MTDPVVLPPSGHSATVSPLTSQPAGPLKGRIRVPGDKSISHRALMLASLAIGETRITGLLEGDDVLRTAAAMRALGARVTREADGGWRVAGVGIGGLAEPSDVIDLGNSGTGARLLMGLIAGHGITAFLTGDASLRRRPMGRVAEPLLRIGARIVAREGGRLPLAITGAGEPVPIQYRLPVASAQVKSAVLLAGLNTPGATSVIEPQPTRDHTERMIRHFGGTVDVEESAGGEKLVTLIGQPELGAADLTVPGDPSSAAFAAVAALLLPGSEITVENIGINRLRIGLFDTLIEMGADITFENERVAGGEPVADLRIRASRLKGVEVPAERAPRMIDEYPILAIAAGFAAGKTVMRGLGELRVKESDRLAAIARGLKSCGVDTEIDGDDLIVLGRDGDVPGGATIATDLDHRPAMAFLVCGMAARQPVAIDDGETINTSFPGFAALMNGLGGRIAPTPGAAA
ncbi:MAG: aroA [Rhodospirillales bacterium]|nr:aroA [Rhodospirillales bacterium]